MTLHIDFETRSELDLRKVGLYNYVRHASTDVWCMSFAFGGEEPRIWTPDDQGDDSFYEYVYHGRAHDGHRILAHNAPFEMAVWENIMVPRYGFPAVDSPAVWDCTMSRCYAMGMPGNLEDAALALGLSILKDTEGRNLMLKMADRNRYPTAKPEDLKRLYAYCQQDVRVERELHKRLLPLSDKERKVWLLDYKINQRGVQVDMESAKAAVKLAETIKNEAATRLSELTAGAVQAVTAVQATKDWLQTQGVEVDGLAKQDVVDLLASDVALTPKAREVLTIRQEAAKASTAKFEVMVRQAGDDGRLRNMYQYHGAATGRWAGRGVQTSNLVRDMPKAETVEKIMALVRAGDYDTIDMIYGAPLSALSRCSRSFFVAPPGKKLISGDWSNVEGRGQAWFAGEDWKLKAFVASDDGSGPGIYELAYSRMFGVPVATVINPSEERQVGKVSELAFGYQGGVGSFHTMSKNYGVKVSDAKAEEFKQAWRAAHPKIVQTWKDIQIAAINAVRHVGETYGCGYPGRIARFKVAGSFLWCLLPSGRAICFPYPKILEGEYGPQLTYMSKPGQDKKDIIYDPKNVSNWARVSTYGGSLFNNIIQGTCRDFLSDCMLELEARGASVVLHTYDDINIEVADDKTEKALPAMRSIMETLPAWAAGFPLKAKVEVMQRYGK
jgi:DNA polymerase